MHENLPLWWFVPMYQKLFITHSWFHPIDITTWTLPRAKWFVP